MTGSRPVAGDDEQGQPTRAEWTGLAAVLVVATAARFYDLDTQLWIDEISALEGSIRRPAADILTRWPGAASHILYEFVAHASRALLGESPFSIRLPAALFGVGGVAALWALVRPRFGPAAALTVAGLLALSYHHVFYSQNARGYTALIFFALVATAFLDRFVRRGAISFAEGVAYAVAGALTAYVQPFGLMVLPGHAVAVLVAHWLDRRREPTGDAVSSRALLLWIGAALGLVGVLYAPFAHSILAFSTERSAIPSEGAKIGVGFLLETLDGLVAAFGGLLGVLVAASIGLLGVWVWLRRAPVAFVALVAPLVLQTGVFLALGAGVHPRYYALALPLIYAFGGVAVVAIAGAASERLPVASGARSAVLAVGLIGIVAASAVALVPYYRYPKQDYLGAMAAVDRLSVAGERKVGVYIAGHVLKGFYGTDFESVDSYGELAAIERASGRPIWLVTTLETILGAHDPALLEHIRSDYERVEYLPGTVGDGAMRIYRTKGAVPGA